MRRSSTALFAFVLLSACGSTVALEGRVYRGEETSYRIGELDEGWQRINAPDNDLAFRNEAQHAVIQVNATCDPLSDVPLSALTNHLLIGFTEREIEDQRLSPLDGREALRTAVSAKLDGVARDLILYVMKKDGCTYDFSLIVRPGASSAPTIESFDDFVASFAVETRR